ncbi:MFS transporter [Brevibacterium sp. UCMA 11754]|uniref:MFS transporter n=1 Tax=Brevibacterium sp. UCMA 11754 TaxID=2749198 RepID=UPI001F3D0397|nr:MFS transporter [Brevibacterium sp. UCMA 11754]MCF2572118.1 MHS family MFS transporter [Brevibacterium sp. UCMA 11754]MCF2572119.1 MHS family MFS transporter [Brevibacterium sp. UCMA 11754]MCF2573352.1 MHS family MFS transporter [Brevibacterium sp. UCMA 11754]
MTESSPTPQQGPPPVVVDDEGRQLTLSTVEMRRILASSFIGSAIEFYDFLLYATASSIVFASLYFTGFGSGSLAVFASFATLAAGYLARPLGGVIFGHFGDRLGRKKTLVLSMIIMGSVTVIVGLMPPASMIGIIAPISLLVLRVIQGIAVGGEWGGAALMALEHAPKAKRGFAASFANAGGPAGAVLATVVMSVMTVLTGDQFVVWGWRIPFLLSAVLIVVGLVIRLKVSESPVFQTLEEEHDRRRIPIFDVLCNHLKPVLIGLAVAVSVYTTQSLVTVWGVSMAVDAGEDKTWVLNWKAGGSLIMILTCFVSARLSDRIGRARMIFIACLVVAASAFPITFLIGSGRIEMFSVAILFGQGIVQGLIYGPISAYVAELFPASVRYTGASVAYQGAAALGAGITPMLASALMLLPFGGLWWVGTIWALVALFGALVVALHQTAIDPENKVRARSQQLESTTIA